MAASLQNRATRLAALLKQGIGPRFATVTPQRIFAARQMPSSVMLVTLTAQIWQIKSESEAAASRA
jgi:hypothetical protein